jgi:DNA-directed RNA polymerase sigma subunit (sigma70/sigma32)
MGVVDRARARRLLHDCRSTGRRLGHADEIRLARLVLDGRWAERHRPVFADRVTDGREAARLLELHCLGVVVHVARRYRGRGVDLEDLVQEGWFGVRRVDVTAADAYDGVEQQELAAAVRHALAGLGPREREVVQRRFGFRSDDLETLDCIGRDIGVTRERIRQIESTALQKLRQNRNLLNSAP